MSLALVTSDRINRHCSTMPHEAIVSIEWPLQVNHQLTHFMATSPHIAIRQTAIPARVPRSVSLQVLAFCVVNSLATFIFHT